MAFRQNGILQLNLTVNENLRAACLATETVDTFIALAKEDLAVARKVVHEFPRDAAFHIEQV